MVPGLVHIEDGRAVVAPPEAVMGRACADEARAKDARHATGRSKCRADASGLRKLLAIEWLSSGTGR